MYMHLATWTCSSFQENGGLVLYMVGCRGTYSCDASGTEHQTVPTKTQQGHYRPEDLKMRVTFICMVWYSAVSVRACIRHACAVLQSGIQAAIGNMGISTLLEESRHWKKDFFSTCIYLIQVVVCFG